MKKSVCVKVLRQTLLAAALLSQVASQTNPATYTIIAPTVVRPNTDYLVAISVFNVGDQEQQDIELRIQGRSEAGEVVDIRETTTVASEQTQIVRLRVGDLGVGTYSLNARGRSPIAFEKSQKLEYVHKGYSIFIQTDKAIYRPGNKVKFRAIVVSPKLKPAVIGSIDVVVNDGHGNQVRRWDRVFTTQGVFAGEFDLAPGPIGPVLGDWNITVDVSGQMASKKFQVAEYILPKFAIDIDLPDYGILGEPKTRVVIRASNANGSPVIGEATIAVFPSYKSSSLQPVFIEPVRKVVDIAGRVEVTFDNLDRSLGLVEDYTRQVVFDVHIKEENTERIQNATAVFSMFRYDYKLQLVKTADAYRPGMPYTAYLKVAHQDDRPVKDDLNSVSIKWGFGFDTAKYNRTEYPIPDDGIIKLRFLPPLDSDNSVLGLEAKYKDLDQWFSTIPSANSQSRNYIQATLKTAYPEVGANIKIGISSTKRLATLTYAVFGRGNLVFSETIEGSDTDFNELSFKATSEMAPRCRLVVYFISDNGEIVADALEFEVAGTLTNFVEIFTSKRQSFPGKSVTVNVKSKPNSFVGIMAVDSRVNSLNLGHDITMEDVVDEIRTYDSARDPSFIPWFKVIKPKTESLQWHTGSSGSRQVFEDSSTAFLTNGELQKGRSFNSNATQVVHHGENRPFGRPLPKPDAKTLNPDLGPGLEYESATRPPLAGPYAFSKLPKPVDDLPKFYLKRDIPETWLFMNTTTDLDGKASIPVIAPEQANSSWIITGFALDDLNGMGITTDPGFMDIFQPFYVQVDLPQSVKQGETLAVEMVVYNYLKRDVSAEVTLENTEDGAFVFGSKDPNSIENSSGSLDLYRTKRVEIRPGRGTLVSFLITPVKIGVLDVKITAKSSVGQDILIKKLVVEPSGDTIYVNRAVFLDLRSSESANTPLEKNVTIQIPRTAVKGSERIFIDTAPDPMGPPMNNLHNLLNFPPGGGEQNLLKILPAAIVISYLKKTGSLGGKLENTARQLMEIGYQQQLTYRLEDGSFSPFGLSVDRRGSTWITALTASALRQASAYIDVDESVIMASLAWLIKKQAQNGSFPEVGPMTYKLMQDDPISTTAAVIIAYHDNKQFLDANHRNSLNKGISFMAGNWDSIDTKENPHALAIVTYAMHLTLHPLRDLAWRTLDSLATIKDGKKWWQLPLEDFEAGNPWTSVPNSVNIAMTSYALLIMLSREDVKFDDTIPVVNWLLEEQNFNGGFASTPDTYVGLQALSEFSTKLRIPERGSLINLQYSYEKTARTVEIDSSKPTIVQRRILPPETRQVRLRATGGGVGLVQVGYEYNVDVTGAWPSFVVNPQVFRVSTSDHMKVTVCANYIEGGSATSSNMAVMEIFLPSGFTVDRESLYALRRYQGVKRVDPEMSDTKAVIYFEAIGRSEVCPTISAYRTHRVANQRPAAVLVYDYYDQTRRARAFYEPVTATLCEICLGEDCPDDGCPVRPRGVSGSSGQSRDGYGANVDRIDYLTSGNVATANLNNLNGLFVGLVLLYLGRI